MRPATTRTTPHVPLAARRALVASLAALLAACGDGSRGAPAATAPDGTRPSAAVAVTAPPPLGGCTNATALAALVNTVFGAGSPNANSALSKLASLQRDVEAGDRAAARKRVIDLVDFIVKKNAQNPLPGAASLNALVVNLLCYAGVTNGLADGFDLIDPGDPAQVTTSFDGQVGVKFRPDPVSEQSVIAFRRLPDPTPDGVGGPLDTKLDQYPGFWDITLTSENNVGLRPGTTAQVEICAGEPIPQAVLDRARVGHYGPGDAKPFELLDRPADSFLTACTNVAAAPRLRVPGWLQDLAALVSPKPLGASMVGGGVGGTVTEFSPFGIVDAVAFAVGGGVGGTVTEFKVERPAGSAVSLSLGSDPSLATCSAVRAPIGTPLPEACRPAVQVRTFRGTKLQGVAVTWSALPGDNGTIAPWPAASAPCGAVGTGFATTTSASGAAWACWTMPLTDGRKTVTATLVPAGDMPAGSLLARQATDAPASSLVIPFTATATPPAAIEFTQQPAAGSAIVAGTEIPLAVRVTDAFGTTVLGFAGPITLSLDRGGFAAPAVTTVTAIAGTAAFPGLRITQAGTGYVVRAGAAFAPAPFPGNAFDVVAAAAAQLVRVAPATDPVNVAVGASQLATVEVRDAFQNPVAGTTVRWTASGTTTGSVTPGSAVSGTDGRARATWTFGSGTNLLLAEFGAAPTPAQQVVFTATSAPVLGQVVNSCPVGGSGDRVQSSAVWMGGAGNNVPLKEVTFTFASNGRVAGDPAKPVTIRVDARVGSFTGGTVYSATTTALVRGSSSSFTPATFVFPTAIPGANGNTPVTFRFTVVGGEADLVDKLTFNTGICAPGQRCNQPLPRGCDANQVANTTLSTATSAIVRRGVAITVRSGS